MRQLAIEDVSGLVESEVTRNKKNAETRKRNRGSTTAEVDEQILRNVARSRIHELYAAKVVRRSVFDAISAACWKAVCQHAVDDDLLGSEIASADAAQPEIGARLGTDDHTIGQWDHGTYHPGGDKVLSAVVLVLQAEFREVCFPKREPLLSSVARRTIALIRDNEFPPHRPSTDTARRRIKSPTRVPTGEEICAVRAALRHPDCDALLLSDTLETREEMLQQDAVKRCIKQTLATVRMAAERPTNDRVRRFKDAFFTWVGPYLLFRIGLASGWRADLTPDELPGWESLDEFGPAE